VHDWALHHRDREIVPRGCDPGHVHATKTRAPQADSPAVDLRPRPEMLQCRHDVAPLLAHRDVLAWLTVGGAGVAVVERQRRDPGTGEVLFVLRQHHLVRRAEPVHQHNGRMWPWAGRQRQPRRASDAATREINPLGGNGRRHGAPPS